MATAFLAQGYGFLRQFSTLREAFPLDPTMAGVGDWEAMWNDVAQQTRRLFEKPLEKAAGAAMLEGAKEGWNQVSGLPLQEAPSDRIRGTVDFDAVFNLEHPRAVHYLRDVGAEKVTGVNELTKANIRQILVESAEQGRSYSDTSERIIDRFAQFAVGKPQQHIDSRAHLVAVTETANAYCEGELQVIDRLEEQGQRYEMHWVTMGDDRVSDGCQTNEDAGWIDAQMELFPSGDRRPPRFPGCRCDLEFRRVELPEQKAAPKPKELPGPEFSAKQAKADYLSGEDYLHKGLREHRGITEGSMAKDQTSEKLAKVLGKDRDFQATVKACRKQDPYLLRGRYGTDETRNLVDNLVNRWAITSADEDNLAIALQRAAQDEFGLGAVSMEHISKSAMAEAATRYQTMGNGLRSFLRAQYDLTQAELAANGIRSIQLYRGFAWTHADDATKFLGQAIPPNPVTVTRMTVRLQPISSFSVSPTTAAQFAAPGEKWVAGPWNERTGYQLFTSVRVPAERILATPRTGFGCLSESEFVVLGGKDLAVTGVFQDAYLATKLGVHRTLPTVLWQEEGAGMSVIDKIGELIKAAKP